MADDKLTKFVNEFNSRMEYFKQLNDCLPINLKSNKLTVIEICFTICLFDFCCVLRNGAARFIYTESDISETYYEIFKTMFLSANPENTYPFKYMTELNRKFSSGVHKESCCHEVLIYKFKKFKQKKIDKSPILQKFDNNENHWDDFTNKKIIELFNVLKEQINFTIEDDNSEINNLDMTWYYEPTRRITGTFNKFPNLSIKEVIQNHISEIKDLILKSKKISTNKELVINKSVIEDEIFKDIDNNEVNDNESYRMENNDDNISEITTVYDYSIDNLYELLEKIIIASYDNESYDNFSEYVFPVNENKINSNEEHINSNIKQFVSYNFTLIYDELVKVDHPKIYKRDLHYFFDYLIHCFSKYHYNLEIVDEVFKDFESQIFNSFVDALECCHIVIESCVHNGKQNVKVVFKNTLIIVLYLLNPINFNVEEIIETFRTDFKKLQDFLKFLDDVTQYNCNIYKDLTSDDEDEGIMKITLELLMNELKLLYKIGSDAFDIESSDLLQAESDKMYFALIIIIHGPLYKDHIPCYMKKIDGIVYLKNDNEMVEIAITNILSSNNRLYIEDDQLHHDIKSIYEYIKPQLFRKNLVFYENCFDKTSPFATFNKDDLNKGNTSVILQMLKINCFSHLEKLSKNNNWLQIMNSIAGKAVVTTKDLKNQKVKFDVLHDIQHFLKLYNRYAVRRYAIFNMFNDYINNENNNCFTQYDKYELAVLYQKLYHCIVQGDYHFVPDFLNQSTRSYFLEFNHPKFKFILEMFCTNTNFLKDYFFSKDSKFYRKFINLNKPLKSLNQQYNIDRPLVCRVLKYGINHLLNEANKILSVVTNNKDIILQDEILDNIKHIKENLKESLHYITDQRDLLFAKVGISLEEMNNLIHKYPLPSESIKSLCYKVIPIDDDDDNSNLEEDLVNNINLFPVEKIDNMINKANDKVSEILESFNNNESNEKLEINETSDVESLQNQVMQFVIQNLAIDSSQSNAFSNLILFYVLYNITEIEEYKAMLQKYGWIYTLAKIGDELSSVANLGAERYMISILPPSMDVIFENKQGSIISQKNINVIKQQCSNIDVTLLIKEFRNHKQKITKQIYTRLNWIADVITWTIIDNNFLTQIISTFFSQNDEKLKLLEQVLEAKFTIILKKFTVKYTNDISINNSKKDIRDDFNDVLVDMYKKFCPKKKMNLKILTNFIQSFHCQFSVLNKRLVLHTTLKLIDENYITDKRLVDRSNYILDEKLQEELKEKFIDLFEEKVVKKRTERISYEKQSAATNQPNTKRSNKRKTEDKNKNISDQNNTTTKSEKKQRHVVNDDETEEKENAKSLNVKPATSNTPITRIVDKPMNVEIPTSSKNLIEESADKPMDVEIPSTAVVDIQNLKEVVISESTSKTVMDVVVPSTALVDIQNLKEVVNDSTSKTIMEREEEALLDEVFLENKSSAFTTVIGADDDLYDSIFLMKGLNLDDDEEEENNEDVVLLESIAVSKSLKKVKENVKIVKDKVISYKEKLKSYKQTIKILLSKNEKLIEEIKNLKI